MGKKEISGMACLLLAFAVVAGTGCNRDKKAEPADSGSISGPVMGDLAVISATPRGEIRSLSDSRAFVVVFDHPMTALEAVKEEKGSSFLKIKPGIRGKTRWIGTRALTFIPDHPLAYATRYEVTVPAGTRSIDGFSLPREESWMFETPRPRVVGHTPLDDEQGLRPDATILVAFNQPVSPQKARKSIVLTGTDPDGKSVDLGFKISRPDAKTVEESGFETSPSRVLRIEPRSSLKPDFGYTVEIREGLASDEGPLRSSERFLFGFETFKTFVFKSLDYGGDKDPQEPLVLQFSNPVVYKKFVESVSFEPAVAIPDYYSDWDQSSPRIWLSLPFQPETEYTLRIPAGLEDDFGNKLGQDIVRRFKTPSFSPSVTMTTGYGVVESYADPRYPLFVMNADKVLMQAATIRKDGVIPLLTMPKIFWTNESLRPAAGFSMEKTIEFKAPRNQRKVFPLDLKPLLKGGKGLVFLQLDTESAAKYERYPKAFIQVTDLGISAKFSPENNVIWATELRSGLPVAGADVELRDDANAVLWRGRTDGDGRAETPGWRILGLQSRDEWSKPQQWVFVSRGQDTAIASSEWGTGVYPYRFGIEYDWNPMPETIRGYLFTERGIYKSGETVHVKGILRRNERGRWALPSAREVDFEIVDPFEKSVSKARVPVDGFGSFHLDFETTSDASLGLYRMTASVPPEGGTGKPVLVSDSFRVEAFRPAEFEVHLRTLQEDFVFGGDYMAGLRADYLSGGGMAGRHVTWHLRLNATGFQPPGHEGYAFGNGLDWDAEPSSEGSRLLASGVAELDARGELEVRIPLVPEKEKDSVSATLEATVESPSRRTVSSRIQTVVHRGEHYIGLQPGTSFLEQGKTLPLNIIAVDPRGIFLKGRKISVRLFRREWRSVRQAGVGGGFRWHTEKEDIEVSARDIESKEGPTALEFKPEKSGLYFFKAEGKDGRGNDVSSSTYVYVTGKDYVSWEQRDDDTIEIVPDKETYKPGETAKLLVKSPYENAKALVTVEREFIIESRVLEIRGSSSHIGIPIKADHLPNVFVSVLLVQGRTDGAPGSEGQDVGQPSFKMGYANLSVSPLEKKLKVDLSRDRDSYGPKEPVTLRIKVRDATGAGRKASVALAVVDVGVLNLIGYQTPDVFAGYYGEKPLSVETSETRLHVVGQRSYGEKGEDTGGGGEKMFAASPALSEVELRKDFKSTAYWNPSIETDEEGVASVSFDLPANLTTFRVMAVAQTAASDFGRSEDLLRVSKSLQLQPSLPRFARAGDEFAGGVVVRNLSDKRATINMSLDVEGVRCSDSAPRALDLEAGEAREVLFPLKAELPGRAGLAFRARMGDEADGLEIVLPVHLPRPLETVAFSGQTDGAVREFVKIPGDAFAEEGRLDVQASPTALGGLKGGLDYLENYPYLCLEQRLSRLLPYLAASDVIFDFHLTPLDAAAARKMVQTGLSDVYEYQTDEGAFAAWTDSSRASPYLTAYAVFALIKAREAGYEVDSSSLDTAAEYLKSLLREEPEAGSGPYGALSRNTTMAFAVYDLALLGHPEPAYMERLFKDRQNLSLFGKTMLFKSFRLAKGGSRTRDLLLDELMNMIRVAPADAHFEEAEDSGLAWIYSSNLRTTAFILQALIEAGSDHPLIPQIARWIVNKKSQGHWGSTQTNFYALYALNEFYRKYEKGGADFNFGLSLDSRVLLDGSFRKIDAGTAFRSTKLAEFGSGTTLPLDAHKEGAGTLSYDVRMIYAPRGRLPAADQGIALVKRLETPAGKPVSAVRAGDLVVVTLDIVVPQERLFVVVDDPLPAGFEAVNPVFATESEEALRALDGLGGEEVFWWEGFNHTEMRDDRILLFADSLRAGLHTHRYLIRALTPGAFRAPGTKVEEMYSPEVFGRSAEQDVTIEK